MATDTPSSARHLVIYEIFVRNHGPHGTFADVTQDLPRIQKMGVDIIWLMPIHPIGKIERKGTLGSPYSISDYRGINPEYGALADFKALIEKAHQLGMAVMIDVVYNHTAHDSVLVAGHPDWFHQTEAGVPVTTVPDWSDVIDLKHPNDLLTTYLVDTLKMWAQVGVDGFRCDVAPLVPVDIWVKARHQVAELKPGVTWLAESVHASFIIDRRYRGLPAASDGELYQAFDLTYDYDIWPVWQAAVLGEIPLSRYLDLLQYQDCVHPMNSVKMRCVENHDNRRIMDLAGSTNQGLAWTAFQAFNKGAFLIYAGEESAEEKTPSLFNTDKVNWGNYSLQPFLTRLALLKKDAVTIQGKFALLECSAGIQAVWSGEAGCLYGVFNVSQGAGEIGVQLADGVYTNLLDDTQLTVKNGQMDMPSSAAIVRGPLAGSLRLFLSELL